MSIASDEQCVVDRVPKALFIDGAWRQARGGGRLSVEDPSNGESLAEVSNADVGDGLDALEAAVAAQGSWARTAPRERADVLRRAFEEVVRRGDDLALLMTLEMGKPLAESRAEVAYAADYLRWFSEEAVRIAGTFTIAPNGAGRILAIRQPVGPALLITPWNFPLAMGARKIAPALAAGCTMIVKPAAQTPLTMLALAEILQASGVPPGVVNVVPTSRPGALCRPIIESGLLRKLSFTGSTAVGVQLLEQAAGQVLRVSMELGGNAPFIVFDDADVNAAIEGAMLAKMRNMGEACTAANRFLVADEIAEGFAHRLAARMGSLRMGRGTQTDVQVGPLIDARAVTKVAELVADARDGGARLMVGGEAESGSGYFFPPTVLADVARNARLLREEIFGPVAPIVTFATETEAIELANATTFGLAAYVYTRDIDRALRVAEALEVGMVGINRGVIAEAAAPFGGIKHSGIGREGGREGIDEYLETKYLALSR